MASALETLIPVRCSYGGWSAEYHGMEQRWTSTASRSMTTDPTRNEITDRKDRSGAESLVLVLGLGVLAIHMYLPSLEDAGQTRF